MERLIALIMENVPVIFYVVAWILALCHRADYPLFSQTLLFYMLSWCVSATGVWGFFGHVFMSERAASSIGWKTSPFQKEVGCAGLATGILGCLTPAVPSPFWGATVIAFSIFMLGAAFFHVVEIIKYKNYSRNNAGMMLWMDILIPLTLIITLSLSHIPVR